MGIIIHALCRMADLSAADQGQWPSLSAPMQDTVESKGIAAIISGPYAPDIFEQSETVERLAVAHNALLVAAVEEVDLLPVRLGALYADTESVTQMLNESHIDICERLDLIAGCVEYAVLLKARLNSAEPTGIGSEPSEASSGRDYLKAKLDRSRRARVQRTVRDETIEAITAGFKDVSTACLSGRGRRMANGAAVYSLALLRPRQISDDFLAAISHAKASADQANLDLEVTGPWPAYSFLDREAVDV